MAALTTWTKRVVDRTRGVNPFVQGTIQPESEVGMSRLIPMRGPEREGFIPQPGEGFGPERDGLLCRLCRHQPL